jgi:hypothetical protein
MTRIKIDKFKEILANNKSIRFTTLIEYFSFLTLTLSSIAGNKNTVNIATDEDYYYQENNQNLDSNKYILRKWEIMPISQLNSSYFQLDTSQYQELISH